jgi:hypothetical protein
VAAQASTHKIRVNPERIVEPPDEWLDISGGAWMRCKELVNSV